jgi:YD repeat-containing protein
VQSVTDALGRVTTNTYGVCCDRLVAVTDPLGFVTRFAYDFVGNRTQVTDANNFTTVMAYDARKRPVTVTNAAGEVTRFSYLDQASSLPAAAGLGLGVGADGSAVITTNPQGEANTEIRDGLGRTVRRSDALGHATTMTYDLQITDAGVTLVASINTDALNHTATAYQDGAGRTRLTLDALGKRATAGFDANGNRLTWRDANGVGQDCVFDNRNRDVQCTDTAGAVTRRSYDGMNNIVASVDALGKADSAVFDLRNRKTSTTDRIGATTSFTYDVVSNLLTITDADATAGVTRYGYDTRNLLISEIFPTGQQGQTRRLYTYDAGRRLTGRAVQAVTVSGTPIGSSETTAYAYDAANRLLTRGYADGKNDTFAYDHASRLTRAATARYGNEVQRAYDAAGRLTSEHLVFTSGIESGEDLVVGYGYDAANRPISLTYPDGSLVTRDYTARNELFHIWDGAQLQSARTYDQGGRLVQSQLGNGLSETRTYVVNDNLVATITVPGVTNFAYQYDTDKRKTVEQDLLNTDQSQRFAYDDQSRLTTWKRSTGVAPTDPATVSNTWALSPVGDWKSVTTTTSAATTVENRSHNAVHELLSINGTALGYDAKGNLTRDDQGQQFTWDVENRLQAATNLQQGQGNRASYAYDARTSGEEGGHDRRRRPDAGDDNPELLRQCRRPGGDRDHRRPVGLHGSHGGSRGCWRSALQSCHRRGCTRQPSGGCRRDAGELPARQHGHAGRLACRCRHGALERD